MDIQWPLLIFSLLAGCGGGVLVFSGISEFLGIARKTRFPAVVAALIVLIVGGIAAVLHLGQPGNIMAAATNIFSFSGISVELIMLGINVIVAIVYLIFLRREDSQGATKVLGAIAIITGLLMAFVVGNGYVIVGQPYWNTITLPLAYLTSGLATGATLFASLMVFKKENNAELKKIGPYVIGALILQAVAFLAYGAVIGFVGDALLYWGGAIVIGTVVAVICAFLQANNPMLAYGACVCALIGGICFRALMWTLGSGYLAMFAEAAGRGVLGL